MSYFIRNGNTFRVSSEEAMDLHQMLPVGNYTIKKDMFENLYLEMVDSFMPLKKLYGNTTRHAERILNTFHSRDVSTGVMLNGEKGSGKTLLAKQLSIDAARVGIPTLIINDPWTGDKFNKFLQDIEQPCVVLFDEFEKVYDSQDQERALTLLDGVFPSKKLFVITCNDKWRVNEHMRNRPGRIYYMIDFKGLDAQFITEYCDDVLINKEHTEKIVSIATLFEQFNFDMLKALVEEMNRYNETPQEALSLLNAKPEFNNSGKFDVKLFVGGVEITRPNLQNAVWHGNPLSGVAGIDYDTDPEGDDMDTYQTAVFTPNDIKKVDAENGSFNYMNADNHILILTRQKVSNYNYLAL
jgi:hypothetical protein